MRSCNSRVSRTQSLLLFICVTGLLGASQLCAVDESEQSKSKTSAVVRKSSAGPYCGLYCLYVTIKLAGREVDFRELAKHDYVGSNLGSSLDELKKAARDNGLCAAPVEKLNSRMLRRCQYPLILHVRSSVASPTYDHYELFLGERTGQARLFDAPGSLRSVPFRELAPCWDGSGLIVSTEPIDLAAVFAPARRRFMLYAACAVSAILALHGARRRLPQELLNTKARLFALSATQAGAFAVVALLCGLLYHFANDEGLLANANATASIQEAHQGNFIPKVSERKVHKLLDTDAIFIDARFARDYEAGHLEGAISVPVDANDAERCKATAHISKDARIVLYCQSAGCKFAETVAIKLKADGFSNVSIFRGGWAEWVATNGSSKEAAL